MSNKNNQVAIINRTAGIKTHINAITKLNKRIRTDALEIALRLAIIKALPPTDFEALGYKNIVDLAADKFGYAKQTTYKFITCAERFITATGKETKLCHYDENGNQVADYSIGQLIELCPLTDEEARVMDECGDISPDMTTKELRKIVKEYLKPEETQKVDEEDAPDPIENTKTDKEKAYEALMKALDNALPYAEEEVTSELSGAIEQMKVILADWMK